MANAYPRESSVRPRMRTTKLIPHGRVQQWTVEQSVDAPQCMEETFEVVRLFPREGVQQRIAEQIVDVPQ